MGSQAHRSSAVVLACKDPRLDASFASLLERHWLAIGSDDPHAELPALVVLVKLEQDFVGSGLEVNRHAILVDHEPSGRELLEHQGSVHPDLLAVIDAEQKYGVDRLLELDLGVRIANAVVAVGDRCAEVDLAL